MEELKSTHTGASFGIQYTAPVDLQNNYSRTPRKRVSNLLLLAIVFSTPAGSTSPYATIHALQLAMESAPSSCMVPGNPAGAATAGGMIGATRTSEKRCAEPLKALASAIMIRRSIPSKRAVTGNKALAIAPANHAGAILSPAKLWMTLTKSISND